MVLFGSSKEKETLSSLKAIEEKASMIFFIQANHFRAKPV
jgi:hypothetical protein